MLVHRRSLRLGVAGRLVRLKGFALVLHALHRLRREGTAAELHIAEAPRNSARTGMCVATITGSSSAN
jgi:hypothetical protein